jgi:hypothetical protein
MTTALTNPTTFTTATVVTAQVLARGNNVRGTIDLANKVGAFLYPRIGRGGTTAVTNGIVVQVRAVPGLTGSTTIHPVSNKSRQGGTTTAVSTTCATTDSNSGTQALNVALITGFSASDVICIQDSGGGVTRLEWAYVSKTATGVLTLDAPLQFTHTAVGADTVRNQSDVFSPIWLEGGRLYEVIFDYGRATTGDSMTVQAISDIYPSDSTT